MFICNHCPYVKAVEDRLIRPRARARTEGVQLVGVCANDAENYPDDAFDELATRWRRARLRLPLPARRGAGRRARLRRGLHAGHLRLRQGSPAGVSRADRRFVEGREPRHPARAGGGCRSADRGQAAGARAAAVDGVFDQMASGSLSKNGGGAVGRLGKEDPKGPWRSYLQRKGLKTTQQREAIVDAFLRSSGHVALEDSAVVRAAQAPGRRAGDGLPDGQAARGSGYRGGAPLRARADAVRGLRGAGAPRSPDLRQLRLHHGVRERRDRGAAGHGGAPNRLQCRPPPPRAFRTV